MRKNRQHVVITRDSASRVTMTPKLAEKLRAMSREPIIVFSAYDAAR